MKIMKDIPRLAERLARQVSDFEKKTGTSVVKLEIVERELLGGAAVTEVVVTVDIDECVQARVARAL